MLNARSRALRCRLPYATRIIQTALIVLSLQLSWGPAIAASSQPHELVGAVIERVMTRLGDKLADDAAQTALQQLFEEELSPHFAFAMITRWVAGKRWETFSAAEREELLMTVRKHIVHVYAALLARGTSVEIRIDPESTVRNKSAKVGAVMLTPSGGDFKLEFRLLRSDDDWKLYDLAVDGLSFARSLRAELNPVIEDGGIAALRNYLNKHQGAAAAQLSM
jgi:phospholipid transport system substrate-binding protein